MSEETYDYLVIGSGPGGYVSAIRAAQLGLKAAVVERAEVGGVCLNWGCIPTKALLQSGHTYHDVAKGKFGIDIEGEVKPNLEAMVKRSRQIAGRLSKGIEFLLKKYQVNLHLGHAYIETVGKVLVKDSEGKTLETLHAKNTCIATGARAREFPHLKFSENVISYREAMTLAKQPLTMLVIGAGAIGAEFADFYQSIGTKVTLVEIAPHILPVEEEALAKELKAGLEKKGCKVLQGAEVKSLDDKGKSVAAEIAQGEKSIEGEFDKVLLAVGVVANSEDMGFENTGGSLEKGMIVVDEMCQVKGSTHVYAIGDVTGGKQLAHKASREGFIAAEHAAGKSPRPLNMDDVPSCTYTSPQVASIGLSEAQLKERGIAYSTGQFPFNALGKALAADATRGFSRVYFAKDTGELLGAHMVGHEVTELISNIAVARSGELSVHEFLQAVFPHPTMSESLHEAIGQGLGESANI